MREDFAVHLHIATSPVWVMLSPASYWYIIDTCCGAHFCLGCFPSAGPWMKFYRLDLVSIWGAGNFLEDSGLNPSPPAVASNRRRAYRPNINMWPGAKDGLLTTVTVCSAKSYLLLQADPRTWEDGLPAREIMSAPRVPFARVRTSNLPPLWNTAIPERGANHTSRRCTSTC